ncbi:MAG: holo-ACP synthase [Elusimicrobia bacterium]|nr:holo-ACP synthase [Candidatus Liberimonas magnetica]
MRVGIDIVEVKRIEKLIKNRKFLKKIYTNQEIGYCKDKVNKGQHFAVRFAAKEAVWKALMEKSITHKDIGIKNLADGRPEVFIKGKKRRNIDISLSHTKDHAIACAIVDK